MQLVMVVKSVKSNLKKDEVMKKLFILSLLVVLLSACSDNGIEPNQDPGANSNSNSNSNSDQNDDLCVDFSPLCMVIYVTDVEGNTLLDTTSPNCIDLSKIVVTYEGKEYSIPQDNITAKPLAYLAIFDGIHLMPGRDGNPPYLYVGEWARDKKWNGCEVELAWGDGTKDILSFTHDYEYDPTFKNDPEHGYGYTFQTEWYLNGEPNESLTYHFVK